MAAQSNLKNMALCLTAVCLICAAILGVVYSVTYGPIQDAARKALEESISKVLPEGGELSDAAVASFRGQNYEYYTSTSDAAPVAYAVKSSAIGFGGTLTLMVGVTPDGVVYNTSVLSHSETPGLGAKCTTDEKFMAQWQGFDPSAKILSVKKDGGDVDAITASTITSRAYALAVSNAVEFVKNLED